MPPTTKAKVAVFLHSGDYDRMHQGLSIAAAAATMERPADVFFFWWALKRLADDALDEPIFGPGREADEARFETRGAPTLRQLLSHLRELGGVRLYACTGSLAIVADPQATRGMEQRVDGFLGWNAILQLTEGVADRFYL